METALDCGDGADGLFFKPLDFRQTICDVALSLGYQSHRSVLICTKAECRLRNARKHSAVASRAWLGIVIEPIEIEMEAPDEDEPTSWLRSAVRSIAVRFSFRSH